VGGFYRHILTEQKLFDANSTSIRFNRIIIKFIILINPTPKRQSSPDAFFITKIIRYSQAYCLHLSKKHNPTMEVKDCNGNLLNEGDTVHLIKDLKVKGSSSTLKRGTVVKNIRLTDNDEEIEGKVEKTQMVLKTCFVKKA
jgi:protein PhnA